MEKIGIVTMYYNSKNYGGILQSYALVNVIETLGLECEQICYNLDKLRPEQKIIYCIIKLCKIPSLITKIRDKIEYNKANGIYAICESDEWKHISGLFSSFEKEIPHSKEVYDDTNLYKVDSEYGALICGSDQVWQIGYLCYDGFWLNFSNRPKCAYAVSTGKLQMVYIEKKILKRKLRGFESISARENSYKSVLQEVLMKRIETVMDPVFLLNADDWHYLGNATVLPSQPYIFAYFLGNEKWHRECVMTFANRHNLRVAYIPCIGGLKRDADIVFSNEISIEAGPREFLSLIEGAEYIMTDSFHAMAFSIIFRKDFFVFDRFRGRETENMNFRISDLLNTLDLDNRRVFDSSQIYMEPSISYENVDELLKSRIDESREYLLQFLRNR